MPNPAPNILPPRHSALASRSPGSSWPKKLSGFITSKNKNPALTEESLRIFNRRNEVTEARYSSSSPYYKGLTDFSLDINREKSSPGGESFATASTKSGSAVKVQQWGGYWLTSKKNDKSSSSSSSSRVMENVVLTKISTKTRKKNDLTSEKERVTVQSTKIENTLISPALKKPLRERDSGPPPESLPYRLPRISSPTVQALLSPPPTPPLDTLPTQALHTSPPPWSNGYGGAMYENEGHTVETERMYNWADKYRPFWLKEFICNTEKALWLQGIVRSWQDTQEDCGHFIFEGKPGVGKRTMIGALLREAFGQDKVQKHHAGKMYLPNAHQEEEFGERQNDQRKNVQKFMRIEGKALHSAILALGFRMKSKSSQPRRCPSGLSRARGCYDVSSSFLPIRYLKQYRRRCAWSGDAQGTIELADPRRVYMVSSQLLLRN